MSAQTWFVTGSSRGFGRALTVAALEAGERVVASARTPAQLDDVLARFGDSVLPVALDVTDPAAVQAAVAAGVERFGGIDVVVNNAGYANMAPVETAPVEDVRRQFETNFWGVHHVSRAAIPVLRAGGGGTVVQFSSVGGRVGGTPGLGSYQAAKFAVDGLTRVLAAETAPFGIRWLTVEPAGFSTDWAGSSMRVDDVPAGYRDTVGAMARALENPAAGDPVRAAEILVRVVREAAPPSHLLLGAGAVHLAREHHAAEIAELGRWAAVGESADHGAAYPVDLPVGVSAR